MEQMQAIGTFLEARIVWQQYVSFHGALLDPRVEEKATRRPLSALRERRF
jgi:hypothetical protein